jgi:hypothetical protein
VRMVSVAACSAVRTFADMRHAAVLPAGLDDLSVAKLALLGTLPCWREVAAQIPGGPAVVRSAAKLRTVLRTVPPDVCVSLLRHAVCAVARAPLPAAPLAAAPLEEMQAAWMQLVTAAPPSVLAHARQVHAVDGRAVLRLLCVVAALPDLYQALLHDVFGRVPQAYMVQVDAFVERFADMDEESAETAAWFIVA